MRLSPARTPLSAHDGRHLGECTDRAADLPTLSQNGPSVSRLGPSYRHRAS